MARTPGVTLDLEVACRIFDEHIPLAVCNTKDLLKLRTVSKSGYTTNWEICKKYHGIINACLVAGDGFIPHPVPLHKHFRTWLARHGLTWTVTDSERPMYHLKVMMSSLQKQKRSSGRPPLRYDSLSLLIDKIKIVEPGELEELAENEDDGDAETGEEDVDEVQIVPIERPPVPCVDVDCAETEEEVDMPNDSLCDTLDALSKALFDPPPPSPARAPPLTPTRALLALADATPPPHPRPLLAGVDATPRPRPQLLALMDATPPPHPLPNRRLVGKTPPPSEALVAVATNVELVGTDELNKLATPRQGLDAPTAAGYKKLKKDKKDKKKQTPEEKKAKRKEGNEYKKKNITATLETQLVVVIEIIKV